MAETTKKAAISITEIKSETAAQRPSNAARASSTGILPGSRRIYVEGSRGIRVPMRAIDLAESKLPEGKTEVNPPIFVYDTSGDFGDPAKTVDITKGLTGLRTTWILGRDDTEELPGMTSAYGNERAHPI